MTNTEDTQFAMSEYRKLQEQKEKERRAFV